MKSYKTVFGSINNYKKGGVAPINDDPKRYVFSNIYEVAATSAPYERVAVGKNLEYVIEAVRAEGSSSWYSAAHDEFVIAMDEEVEVHFIKLDNPSIVPEDRQGAIKHNDQPIGKKMGRVILRRGHQALLAPGTAYQFISKAPATLMIQTIEGQETVFKWADICQSE